MQHQRDDVGNNSPVKVDQGHIAEDLFSDASFGIGCKLEDEETRLELSLEKRLDQAVRQLPGLNHLGLKRAPCFNSHDPCHPEDRIAVMLDQPFAALVVFLHLAAFVVESVPGKCKTRRRLDPTP